MHGIGSSPPLIYGLVKMAAPPRRPGLDDEYRAIINQLRPYSATSVINMALETLWVKHERPEDDIKGAPWLTLLLVKWAVQDKRVQLSIGSRIPRSVFDGLRQRLWDVQGASESGKPGFNMRVVLRKLIYPQLQMQRKPSWGFLRWPALYAKLAPETRNRRQFRAVMGMEPEAYTDLAYCTYALLLDQERSIKVEQLGALRALYGSAVDEVFGLLARDVPSLRLSLQEDAALKVRGQRELFEFPYLSRFPLLRRGDGHLISWHPMVLARGLEEAVHMRLSSLGKEYSDDFSRAFEGYVTEIAMSMGVGGVSESEYKHLKGANASAVEALLADEGCNILVEAKLTLFGDDAMQATEEQVFQKTARVRDAIKQGWAVSEAVRAGDSPLGDRFKADRDFLIVVTSRQMLLGTGERLREMCPAGSMPYPNDAAEQRLPLSRVFVLSVEEFELAAGVVRAGVVGLAELLEKAAHATTDPATDWLLFEQVLAKYGDKAELPALISEARDASIGRVSAALGV